MSSQNQYNNTSTKAPVCWAADPNARGLRVEVSSERSLLLPFAEFRYAECLVQGDDQRLRLVFAAHEVVVRGRALKRIETALQRMELSLLSKHSSIEQPLVTEGQPLILEIEILELAHPMEFPSKI